MVGIAGFRFKGETVKFEPGTEAFHAQMHAHWLRALEAHKREIEKQGPSLARSLTLQRLKALVEANATEDTNYPPEEET